MRFALLGDHEDGLDMARALVESRRHELVTYTGAAGGAETLRRWGLSFRRIGDLEEVLADPAIEAVVVAGSLADRPGQLRRALQSERHVLCVHPADQTPDIAYEAAMIQGDTHCLLLPLLTESFHPGVLRLAELIRSGKALGKLRLIEVERWSEEAVWLESQATRASMPGWDVLRALGGEIAEVSAFGTGPEPTAEESLLLAGRFERGALFQETLLPGQPAAQLRFSALGGYGRAELIFAAGWPGPARLSWRDEDGTEREEVWETWNPWPALVEQFESALIGRAAVGQMTAADSGSVATDAGLTRNQKLAWQDAVRSLELDDAAWRSARQRRATALEYPQVSEEVGFKGTMTLVGCGLLWVMLLLLILSAWFPRLGWAIIPLLVVFLLLQSLRWILPRPAKSEVEQQRTGE